MGDVIHHIWAELMTFWKSSSVIGDQLATSLDWLEIISKARFDFVDMFHFLFKLCKSDYIKLILNWKDN